MMATIKRKKKKKPEGFANWNEDEEIDGWVDHVEHHVKSKERHSGNEDRNRNIDYIEVQKASFWDENRHRNGEDTEDSS